VDSPFFAYRKISFHKCRLFFLTAAIAALICIFGGCGDDKPTDSDKRSRIVAFNGLYYKADSLQQKPLRFAVVDKNDSYLLGQLIRLELVEGDGTLSDTAITTDTVTGIAEFSYDFTGNLGHAVVRLIAPDIDSLDIQIRTDILLPGPGGQAQYVLFDDVYTDVKNFNGLPASVDVFEGSSVIYVNYEAELGVVVMFYDLDTNGVIYDTSSVYGVIVNTNDHTTYTGTTPEGIGIGSTIDSLRSAYGQPDSVWWDSRPPASVVVEYDSLGLTFYCDPSDTSVFEIHLVEMIPSATNSTNDTVPLRHNRYFGPTAYYESKR
jgi:hypothetical protein